MMKYNVHVYGVCRVKVFNVEAENQHEATQKAFDEADDVFRGMEADCPGGDLAGGECEAIFAGYAEDVTGYLVDEVGDDEHVNSRDYDERGQPLNSDESASTSVLEAITLLKRLKEWEASMGGWNNPVWRDVDRMLADHRGETYEDDEDCAGLDNGCTCESCTTQSVDAVGGLDVIEGGEEVATDESRAFGPHGGGFKA